MALAAPLLHKIEPMERNEPLCFEDLSDLLILQRALMEARFAVQARNPEIPGSPLVAHLHQRVVDAIASEYERSGSHRILDEFEDWLVWSPREIEQTSLINTLAAMRTWDSWSLKERTEVARSLVVPFQATDTEIDELVRAASARSARDHPDLAP